MKISIGVTIILIGIPTAAEFYPPLLSDHFLTGSILGWMRVLGVVVFLALLLRFGFSERWFPTQEQKDWYDEVERTANGIKQAWHYSGSRPESEDRKRTVEEVDELIDELKEYRRHQNATDEMVEKMNKIISRWDEVRENICSTYNAHYYSMRRLYFSDYTDELIDLLHQERQSTPQRYVSIFSMKIRNSIERVRRKIHDFRSNPLPYEVHQHLEKKLPADRYSKFLDGHHYLFIFGDPTVELISYDEEPEEEQFNIYQVRYDYKHSPIAVDVLGGWTVTVEMLLDRLDNAEMVDTIPIHFFTPSGSGLEVFENDGAAIRHPDPQDDDEEDSKEAKKE